MIGLILIFVMALGVGGTATVADNARPGDTLFTLDQAVEKVRLSFTRKEEKNELRLRFSEERLEEVKEIEEEGEVVDSSTKKSLSVEQEKKVNTGIELALNLLTELDEASEVEDERLEKLAAELSSYLEKLPEDARVQVSDDRLRIKFDQGPEKIEVKEQGENKTKIEIRTEEGRIKIQVKDGQIEIKERVDEEEENEVEVEAEIFSDKTIVEVEIGDQKTTFVTSANTEESIIAAVVAKFPSLTSVQVKSVLKIETEEDMEENEDDEEEEEDTEDDSDSDEEEEEDENEDEESI